MQNDLKNILESLLFVADGPIDIRTFKQIIPDAEAKEIREALNGLAAEHEARQGGFLLDEIAGGFQFRTRPDYKEWIKKMFKPSPVRLSKAALETLAIIAYHQPIIRADVERIRGVDSGAIIRNLLERKLIRILGKKEIPGRPLIYATTRKFLEIFNLKSLSDMPTLKEIQEFGNVAMAEELAAGPEADGNGSTGPKETDIAETADGTFPRQPGLETPGEDKTAASEPIIDEEEADEDDTVASDIETETSDEPVCEEQEVASPKNSDGFDAEQDADEPEYDETVEDISDEH